MDYIARLQRLRKNFMNKSVSKKIYYKISGVASVAPVFTGLRRYSSAAASVIPQKHCNIFFPQDLFKSLCISCEKVCEKVSTVLKKSVRCGLNPWKSCDCGKVLHGFYNRIYTGKIGYSSLLGGEFCTFST